jgi:multimeric flavodoxin WrbA
MKVVTIFGSPRKEGNTAKVLEWMEEAFKATKHQVDRIDVNDYNVNGCKGCYACQANPDEPACVQKDDAEKLFQRMMAADAIIYASPLYCWGFTSQIKPLIDRHLCLVTGYGGDNWKSLLEGKKSGLLVTCAGPIADNSEMIQDIYKNLMEFAKCDISTMLIVPLTTTPDKLTDETKNKAVTFAEKLMA